MTTIYFLSDKNGEPFYVGKTTVSLEVRLYGHKMDSRNFYYYESKKHDFFKECPESVRINEIEVIDCVGIVAVKVEQYWIHQFKAWGFKLTNKMLICRKKKKRTESF